jgi:DNA-binding NtrC family response regulator
MAQVLIIDDESSVAYSMQRALAAEHSVDLFDCAPPALEALRQGKRYGAILCDLSMPSLSGVQFHEAVLGIDSDQAARIIFVSGGIFTPGVQEEVNRIGNPLLNKPFTLQEIRQTVKNVAGL